MSSPSVQSFEFDKTFNLDVTGESGAGIVIDGSWGAADTQTRIENVDALLATFGKPNKRNYAEWFSAHNFLHYSSNLYVTRVLDEDTALNAGVAPIDNPITDPNDPNYTGDLYEPKGHLFKNSGDFEVSRHTAKQYFSARYAGILGNSLEVGVADADTFDTWEYKDYFDTAPKNSDGSEILVAEAKDEIHVIVIDRLGYFTRIPGSVLETFSYLSKAEDGRDINNANSYYVNVINRTSEYIYAVNTLDDILMEDMTGKTSWGGELLDGLPFACLNAPFKGILGKGTDGDKPNKTAYIDAYLQYESVEDDNMNMIITGNCGGDANHAEVANAVLDLCFKTKRFVGFISPKSTDVVQAPKNKVLDNIIETHSTLNSLHSYGHMSTGYKLQYDKFNDVYRWIPSNADDAGLYARTHNEIGKYASAAGYNRGKYANVVSLAYSPSKTDRDALYKLNINSVIFEKGEGTLLLGDRTLQPKNSAFSYMGTRFLFIDVRLTISKSAKYNLFEINDEFTRSQFRETLIPYLRDIQGNRGIVDFKVICDSSNNPTNIVEQGKFIGDVYIKPQYSIQFIILNFSAVGQSVNFEEMGA